MWLIVFIMAILFVLGSALLLLRSPNAVSSSTMVNEDKNK